MCIPCYNSESDFFIPLLESCENFVEQGILDEIVLIDDGSKDRTFEIASQFNATLLKHENNKGKSAAFSTGIIYGGDKYGTVIMCDDDMVDLKPEHILQSLDPVKNKEVLMTKSPYQQEKQMCPHDYSGFRSINMDFLRPLYDLDNPDNQKWIKAFDESRYGLELILELLCPPEEKKIVAIEGLKSKRRGGKISHHYLHNEIALTLVRLERLGLYGSEPITSNELKPEQKLTIYHKILNTFF